MRPDRRPYAALRHPDVRRYAGGMFVSLIGSQMQNTAIDWHVWVLTGSPLALGAVGLARFLPIAALSFLAVIGALLRIRPGSGATAVREAETPPSADGP